MILTALVWATQISFNKSPSFIQHFKPAFIVHSPSKHANILQTDQLNHFHFEEDGIKHTLDDQPELTPIKFTMFKGRIVPDYKDKDTIVGMAKMSWKAYYEPKSDSEIGFGWNVPGLRGYIFVPSWIGSSNTNFDKVEDVVIAVKGTSFSLAGGDVSNVDKRNDNLLFSCCCAVIDFSWRPICDCANSHKTCNEACIHKQVTGCTYPGCNCQMGVCQRTYFDSARDILEIVKSRFPNARIHTTGHSLGGAMATIMLHMIYADHSINSKGGGTLTYESPAQRMALHRLGLLFDTPVFNFGHNSDPVFTGECKGMTSSCYFFGYFL